MKEIKKVFLLSSSETEPISEYATGLVLVAKDDEVYYQCSTDPIQSFTKAEFAVANLIREAITKNN